jgi:folate-dependent phosphoribosylglycinamide formyltransferase PurN
MDRPADSGKPRITIVTNGNFFSNIALSHLLKAERDQWDFQVIITTGLRKQNSNRLAETYQLLRHWGPGYFTYKFMTYLIPIILQMVSGKPRMVGRTCRKMGIPTIQVRNVNREPTISVIREFAPNLLLSYSCPYKITKTILDIPSIGCLNAHSSLLPAYAGVCTYVHVLANGESITGITVHEMLEKFDVGKIVKQETLEIAHGVSVFGLFESLCKLAGPMLVSTMNKIIQAGVIEGTPQDLSLRTYFGEPSRNDFRQLKKRGFRLMYFREIARF